MVIVLKQLVNQKPEKGPLILGPFSWEWNWFIFDTENVLYFYLHFLFYDHTLSKETKGYGTGTNLLHSIQTVPVVRHKSPTFKDELRWDTSEIHQELEVTSGKYRVHPRRQTTLDDSHNHSVTEHFASLQASSGNDVMAIQVSLYQELSIVKNISHNKMVQMAEQHHAVKVNPENSRQNKFISKW